MTPDEIEALAHRVAKATVTETFVMLGVDMSSPTAVLGVQQDFAHLRASRLGLQAIRRGAILSAIMVFMTGLGSAVWYALEAGRSAVGK